MRIESKVRRERVERVERIEKNRVENRTGKSFQEPDSDQEVKSHHNPDPVFLPPWISVYLIQKMLSGIACLTLRLILMPHNGGIALSGRV